MRKTYIFLLLVLILLIIFKYFNITYSLNLPLPIISELHDVGISESLFIEKINKLNLQFKEGGVILDPDFKKGITIYTPNKHIDKIICGFNYDNHLTCLDYYYKTRLPKENIDKQINTLRSHYIKILGEPYYEKESISDKNSISNKNRITCGIVWGNGEWVIDLRSMEVRGSSRIVNIRYSCWPKGDRLRQFPDQEAGNIRM